MSTDDIGTERRLPQSQAGEGGGDGVATGTSWDGDHVARWMEMIRDQHRDADALLTHTDGVAWFDAPKPRRWHRCKTQTAGFSERFVERCACGAIRIDGRYWLDRNSRRG